MMADLGFLSIDLGRLVHQAFFGGVAAFGFGVLFNLGRKSLAWCALCGFIALAVRTLGQDAQWSLEGATFAATLTVTTFLLFLPRKILHSSYNTLALSACIPMVPGAVCAKAMLGLFAITAPHEGAADATTFMAIENILRFLFTIGAIGAGIAIPTHLGKVRDF